jgi:5-methylcytosine-specific restriction protein A
MGYGAEHRRKREIVLKRDRYLCRYCRNVSRLTEGNIADHVLALVHGGKDTIANMVCCCRRCHDEKTAKHDGGFGHRPQPITRVEQFVPSWGGAARDKNC